MYPCDTLMCGVQKNKNEDGNTHTMKLMTKILAAASLVAAGAAVTSEVHAASTDVDAQANLIQALTATTNNNVDFGDVGFTAAAPGAGDQIDLGSDGSVTAGGNLSTEGGTPAAGQVGLSGSGAAVDVTCSATATLEEVGGDSITMNSIEWELNGTAVFGSAGHTCTGGAETNIAVTGTDLLNIGGRLDGSTYSNASNYTTGVHSTTVGSGSPINFTITYN